MIDINNLCMNCMSALDENGVCPKCGFDSNADFQVVSALPYKQYFRKDILQVKQQL